jgi:hypothetical protein
MVLSVLDMAIFSRRFLCLAGALCSEKEKTVKDKRKNRRHGKRIIFFFVILLLPKRYKEFLPVSDLITQKISDFKKIWIK